MIHFEDFDKINNEIIDAINNILNDIKISSQSNYFLLLSEAEYNKGLENNDSNLNPNTFDNKLGRMKDQSRFNFLVDFLLRFYSFSDGKTPVEDNDNRMHMEMMIYSHIWEAKYFLKKLYRLARLWNNEDYPWDVDVPDMSKHNFIIGKIRCIFKIKNHNMFEIIKNGFHTSLRNAFAHSEYYFDFFVDKKRIVLENYHNNNWELRDITYDDWSRRFVYSASLSYHLLDLINKHRLNLIETLGTDTIQINQPSKVNGSNIIYMKYEKESDRFSLVNN